jgi:MFS family permease
MPWSAFAFATLYFQLQGWSDATASAIIAVFAGSDAIGAFLGGAVGDWAAARFPDHGRIAACQFSVGIGVPMFLLIFQGLPLGSGGWVVAAYAGLLAATGVLISWAATACNNPIFAEIVPPHLRTLVYALDRCLEVICCSSLLHHC